jgi:ribose 5-phosphate isomerase B
VGPTPCRVGAGGLATLPAEMRIALASDHAGFPLKEHLSKWLAESGHAVYDLGTHSAEPVDYPDYAAAVAQAVLDGRADRGILICGSGAGAAVAANKLQGIRASIAHDTYTAHQMVEHDDVNVISLGSRVIGEALAEELVTTFLEARFSREDRHVRRLEKIRSLEA